MAEPIVFETPDQNPMFQAVGRGLQAFSSVELGVNFCFAAMMECPDRKRAIAALNAGRSFEAKLKIVNAVAKVSLSPAQLRTWNSLANKVGRRKLMRDRLAHWTVGWDRGVKDLKTMKSVKIALVPPLWSKEHVDVLWNKGMETDTKPIYQNQIEAFADAAHKLATALMNFSQVIAPVQSGDDNAPYVRCVSIG